MGLVIPLFLMSFSDNMLSKNDSPGLSQEKVFFVGLTADVVTP
jgi:hypothetical protein